MRSKMVVNTLALALLFGGVGLGLAQEQPSKRKVRVEEEEEAAPRKAKMDKAAPEKSKLEDMLAQALKNNPDIRVAAAKMAEAEAELSRARLQVTQKVVALYYAIETQKQVVEHAEKRAKRAGQLSGGAVSPEDREEIRQALALAKAKLAELEAQMPALLGKIAAADKFLELHDRIDEGARADALGFYPPASALVRKAQEKQQVQGPLADRIRKALETPIKVDYKDANLAVIFDGLSKTVPGLSIRCSSAVSHIGADLHFEEKLPVSAVLQALADDYNLRFVVRDYGILVTVAGGEPPGAMTLQEYLRQKPVPSVHGDAANDHTRTGLPWKPPENVEGTVKQIGHLGGFLTITLNSEAGLLIGHRLYLIRSSDAKSPVKYLGIVQIMSVNGKEATVNAIGELSEPPKVGDKVTSRAPAEKKNPPESIEGQVKKVDPASGLMTLTIGSDAGLAAGHTLELFRLHPEDAKQSKYLGKVRILEVEAQQAVAQPVGRLATQPQTGDRVASRLEGK